MNRFHDIVERIVALDARRATTLVVVDGCGAAGKTDLAARLSRALEMTGRYVAVVHFDDFYLSSALRAAREAREHPVGVNFDWRRLREEVLLPLRAGRDAVYRRYDWAADALAESRTVSADGAVVIVEGVYASRRELAALYDLRVWVDCPRDLRLRRGIERDGDGMRTRWACDWMPEEDRYVTEDRPHERADLVVSGTVT